MAQVPEEVLIRFVDEPSHHFGIAHEHFLKKDYAQSAAEIRKGAGFVRLEMARSTEEGGKALAEAALRLEELAENVESGSVDSVDELNAVLARAEQALAFHHELKAEKSWQANNYPGAGHDLKAASMNLKNSLKYAGGKVEVETDAAIKDADNIGQKLLEGARLEDERIGAALEMLGDKIDEVGKKLEAAEEVIRFEGIIMTKGPDRATGPFLFFLAPGRTRTCSQRIRNPLLYPLSYRRIDVYINSGGRSRCPAFPCAGGCE